MKKAELLKMKLLKASQEMQDMVLNDIGEERQLEYGYYRKEKEKIRVYKIYRFYRAAVEEGILKVAIFTRLNIIYKKDRPDFTIFIDSENSEWITYDHKDNRWLSAMIFNLPYETERGEGYQCYGWCAEKEKKVINDYLKTEGEPKKAIREYQTNKKADIRKKKHRSELEQIDEFMNEVPEMPKDFVDWVWKNAYKNVQYMITQPGKAKEGYCTGCRKLVKIKKKLNHNDVSKCPNCKSEVMFKSWGKQKSIKDRKNVGIIQKLKDGSGYVLRVMKTWREILKEDDYKNPRENIWEQYRFRLNNYFEVREVFEFGEDMYSGAIRWCHELNHGYYYVERANTYCTLYENNLDKILEETEAKYVPMKKLLQKYKGYQMYADEVLRNACYRPTVEKFLKLGLDNIGLSILNSSGSINEINLGLEKVEDMMRINKEYLKLAIKMNCNVDELKVMQAAVRTKTRITEETIRDMTRYFRYRALDDLCIILQRGNVEKMMNYLRKLKKDSTSQEYAIGTDYEDYLEQLGRLGMDMDKHNRFPSNFYATHERLSELIREKEDRVKNMQTREKNKQLREVVNKLKTLFYAKSEDYEIVWPMCKNDFQKEGQEQHNCVGGYFERVTMEKTVVFFLRKKEDIKKPFCTVEFSTSGNLIQCRKAYNIEAPDEVMKFMDAITENYKKEMIKRAKEAEIKLEVAV